MRGHSRQTPRQSTYTPTSKISKVAPQHSMWRMGETGGGRMGGREAVWEDGRMRGGVGGWEDERRCGRMG